MEILELQKMWQQYDARITENTRINKEILKRILRTKPEKRIQWMRWRAIYEMVMPIPIMCIALIPNTKFRNEWDFYIGLALLVIMLARLQYQTIQKYHLIKMINFSNPIIQIRKSIIQLEKFSTKVMKVGFVDLIVGLVGICLMCKIPVLTKNFALVTIFIIFSSVVSSYYHHKKLKNKLNKLNAELDEIEELEKE